MGNIAKYTDMSAELPGVRAYVDVRLEDSGPWISWNRTWPVIRTGSAWRDAPDSEERDDDAHDD